VKAFQWINNRQLIVKKGAHRNLVSYIPGKKVLMVTGAHWLKDSGILDSINTSLKAGGIELFHISIPGEPSPDRVDRAVEESQSFHPDAVLAIGGGSVLDAGKAIAAMLCHPLDVKNYLEGVGNQKPDGATLPLIALPTTSGTGSEATKNAVLSQPGPEGFKKSLRHDNFVPHTAIIDSDLLVHCPLETTLYSGMDALTQLMEGWFSTESNLFSEMTARQGLELFLGHFPSVLKDLHNSEARAAVALASYLSGLTLAHAGLGTVHAIAGTLGGLTPLPHGLLCSRLIPPVFRHFAHKIEDKTNLSKMGWLGNQFHHLWPGVDCTGFEGFIQAMDKLEEQLPAYSKPLEIELLEKAADKSGDKNSPVKTSSIERLQFLKEGLNID